MAVGQIGFRVETSRTFQLVLVVSMLDLIVLE